MTSSLRPASPVRDGYEATSRIAKRALAENRTVAELVLDERLLSETELDRLLELEATTQPRRPGVIPDKRGLPKMV